MTRMLSRWPVLFTVLAILGLVLVTSSASADDQVTGIVASGSAVKMVRPDSLRTAVGVEVHATTLEEAASQANERMQRVITGLRSLEIPELQMQTKILSVSPDYETNREGFRTTKIVGYSASNGISVVVRNVPFDKISDHASAILGASLRSGANVTGNLELFVNDPAPIQAQVLEQAVQDARHNAEVMAKGAGVTITGVASVIQEGMSFPKLMRAPMMAAMAPEGGRVPVEVGEVSVSSSVTVRFTHR